MVEEKSGKPQGEERQSVVEGVPEGWRPGQVIWTPLREEPDDESKFDWSLPFWVGEPSP
jgi:hypothetical protein